MDTTDFVVIAGGVAAIAWVLWYFLVATGKSAAASDGSAGMQDILVTVHGGYDPATIHVKAGRPVRLRFNRQETSSCSEEVVFPDFGLRKFLPAFKETSVEINPPKPGTYEFTCGMSMLRGKVIAE